MKLLVLGGTGRVGNQVVASALAEHKQVQVLVRDPNKLKSAHGNLRVFRGNVLCYEDILKAMHGADVVICALSTDGDTTLSASMPLIIEAMYKEGIARMIMVGTAGILQSRSEPGLLRYQTNESRRSSTRAAEEHHSVNNLLAQTDLQWTIVCPTFMPEGPRTGQYRILRDFLPEGGVRITVGDTADCVMCRLRNGDYIQARIGIAY